MIPIFRKIRKKMADDNKPAKYLRYAIGEVILVVIGILIAISINNWNSLRVDRGEEQLILQQLKTEFVQNKNQLLIKIKKRKDVINSCFEILNIIDNPLQEKNEEHIDSLFASILPNFTFDPNRGVINQLLNGGKLNLIKNDSLRQQLSNWSSVFNQTNEEEVIYTKFNLEELRPLLYKNYSFRNIMVKAGSNGGINDILIKKGGKNSFIIGRSKLQLDANKLFTSTEYEGKISSTINWLSVSNIQAQGFIEYSENILKMIEGELK